MQRRMSALERRKEAYAALAQRVDAQGAPANAQAQVAAPHDNDSDKTLSDMEMDA